MLGQLGCEVGGQIWSTSGQRCRHPAELGLFRAKSGVDSGQSLVDSGRIRGGQDPSSSAQIWPPGPWPMLVKVVPWMCTIGPDCTEFGRLRRRLGRNRPGIVQLWRFRPDWGPTWTTRLMEKTWWREPRRWRSVQSLANLLGAGVADRGPHLQNDGRRTADPSFESCTGGRRI